MYNFKPGFIFSKINQILFKFLFLTLIFFLFSISNSLTAKSIKDFEEIDLTNE